MDTDCVLLHLRNTTSEVGHGLRHQLFDSTRSRGFPKKMCGKIFTYRRRLLDFFHAVPVVDWLWVTSMSNS